SQTEPPMIDIYQMLRHIHNVQGKVVLVQVGAFVGNSSNDPIFRFVKEYCGADSSFRGSCTAILIEPVRHLYYQLLQNYADCFGPVFFENVAVSDAFGIQDFYRLREDADPGRQQIPEFVKQLGSLLPDRTTSLWDSYEQHHQGT